MGVRPLWVLFDTLTDSALYGMTGAVFVIPLVARTAATLRYLRETLLFEHWCEALVSELSEGMREGPVDALSKGEPAGLLRGGVRSTRRGEG